MFSLRAWNLSVCLSVIELSLTSSHNDRMRRGQTDTCLRLNHINAFSVNEVLTRVFYSEGLFCPEVDGQWWFLREQHLRSQLSSDVLRASSRLPWRRTMYLQNKRLGLRMSSSVRNNITDTPLDTRITDSMVPLVDLQMLLVLRSQRCHTCSYTRGLWVKRIKKTMLYCCQLFF